MKFKCFKAWAPTENFSLSAAFDTIEHSILLNILQQDFGVVGTALNWFDSFLSGRKQRILVGDKISDDFNLNCGVPQGSCMGPILFTLYVSRLFNIISQRLPSAHGYADDSVMPALKRTRLTASAWRKANWCINCVLMRVMERRERDNS